MKLSLFVIILLCAHSALFAQGLGPEEQRKLLQDVQLLKEKVKELEGNKAASGLKRTNYDSQSTAAVKQENTPSEQSLGPEETKMMMDEIAKLKANHEDAQKYLKQLDKDE